MNQIKIHLDNLCTCFSCETEPRDQCIFDSLDFRLNTGEILCLVIDGAKPGNIKSSLPANGSPSSHKGEKFWFAKENSKGKHTQVASLQPSWAMSLLPWKTVADNMVFGLSESELNKKEKYEAALDWLEKVGLLGCALRLPTQISPVQKLRIALAKVYLENPSIILADNPLSGLSGIDWQVMLEEFLRIWQHNPVPVVFVTSNLDEAIFLSDRIVILSSSDGLNCSPIDNPLSRDERNWLEIIHTEEYEELYETLLCLNTSIKDGT